MIKQMITLDPSARPSFDTLLHTARGTVFAEAFYSFFHNYVSSVNDSSSIPPSPPPSISSPPTPHPIAPTVSVSPTVKSTAAGNQTGPSVNDAPSDALPSDSDHRMERIWADYESVEPFLALDAGEEAVMMDAKVEHMSSANSLQAFEDIIPVELSIPNRDSKLRGALQSGPRAATEGMVINLAVHVVYLIDCRRRTCSHHFGVDSS